MCLTGKYDAGIVWLMDNESFDRDEDRDLPCIVECETCGSRLCSDPKSTLCCVMPKATEFDGMYYCTGCVEDNARETAEELTLVSSPGARAAVMGDSLAGKAGR